MGGGGVGGYGGHDEGGTGGFEPSDSVFVAERRRRRNEESIRDHMRRSRKRIMRVFGRVTEGPIVATTANERHVLQKDFLGVVGTSPTDGAREVEVTRDADAGMRFYLAGVPYLMTSEAGDPLADVGASSTAENSIVVATMPAEMLGNRGAVFRLKLIGEMLQNSGANNTFRFRVKIGSTTAYDYSAVMPNSATRTPLGFEIVVCSRGSADTQVVEVHGNQGFTSAATAGFGFVPYEGQQRKSMGIGYAAEDTDAGDVDITVTQQWSASHANSYYRLWAYRLTFEPA